MIPEQLIDAYRGVIGQCHSCLLRHPEPSMREQLKWLAESVNQSEHKDIYGQGKLIEDFEATLAARTGMESAVFVPSGTIAQQVALKVWCQYKGINRFAMHPSCHLEQHELHGYRELFGLEAELIGNYSQVLKSKDFSAVQADVAGLIVELPMREIGGQFVSWAQLKAISTAARERNAILHIDGARLWQAPAFYQKPLHKICSLADSVYLSFYKDLGAISGAALCGPAWFIEEARIWLKRAGANLYSLYPYVLSARAGYNRYLPDMEKSASAAKWLGEFFSKQPNMSVNPVPVQGCLFHLTITGNSTQILLNAINWTLQNQIQILPFPRNETNDGLLFEMAIGQNILTKNKQWWLHHLADFCQAVSDI